MDDATQKLVDEARAAVLSMDYGRAYQVGLVGRLADALEAERGHIQSLAKWVGVDESEGSLGIACEASAALEAARRPPVSGDEHGKCQKHFEAVLHERVILTGAVDQALRILNSNDPAVRNRVRLVLEEASEEVNRLGREYRHEPEPQRPPVSPEDAHWECDCVPELGPSHCHACSNAVGREVSWSEAVHGVPSQPVYNVEKTTDFLYGLPALDGFDNDLTYEEARHFAAALVAALPTLTKNGETE